MIIEVGVGATEDAAAHGDSQYVLGNLEHAVYRLTVGEGVNRPDFPGGSVI